MRSAKQILRNIGGKRVQFTRRVVAARVPTSQRTGFVDRAHDGQGVVLGKLLALVQGGENRSDRGSGGFIHPTSSRPTLAESTTHAGAVR